MDSDVNHETVPTPQEAPPLVGVSPNVPGEASSKKLGIDVSPKAVEAILRQLKKRGTPEASLRVGLRGGGCSGFTYVIEFHDGPPRARDIVLDVATEAGEPVRVVV